VGKQPHCQGTLSAKLIANCANFIRMRTWEFFVYITTNSTRTVPYVGCTNDLAQRLIEHYFYRGTTKSFAGQYHCYNLLYVEVFDYVKAAFSREKQVKGWTRAKKEALIDSVNPTWKFLNDEVIKWPPVVEASDMRGGK
jgi:putative endonuclease